jgi:hypothetical protein
MSQSNMPGHDYNGAGRWTIEAIQKRYRQFVRQFHVTKPIDLQPTEVTSNGVRCIFPLMDRVIEGIKSGDLACVELGVEFIQEDQLFPFGKTLKSKTARALRHAELTEGQRDRVRKRVIEMLVAGHVPREYKEYARLVRKLGVGSWLAKVESNLDLKKPYVRRYYDYFRRHCSDAKPGST